MAKLICAGCGHANRDGARFCENCGHPLARACPECGAAVSSVARFCDSCGAALSPGEGVVEAALKTVTVVFSDIAGSTALQEALDPESVRRVMGRYYETMRAVVDEHDGTVDKFIGDAVVAVFGKPISREDDALRAVRCAAAMASALERLGDELERSWGVRLGMRTGVNTGELVVSDESILVGDTMNTAARLEQAAGEGEVLIGASTARLVRHAVELEEVEALELKGKAEPVRAWRVISTAPAAAHRATADSPLIGRREPLERLRSALRDATHTRACRLVTVIGSPGLGKSRLAAELAAEVQGQATVLFGHCEPSGEGITFLPVAEVLRAAAGIGEADSPDRVLERLGLLVGSDAESALVARRAAAVLGASGHASAEETFWGVRRVLEAAAQEQPLLVVLDDVHWGQPMFLDLIEHLVEWVRDAPILLVALARPELREVREALASGRRAADVLELEPLDGEESRQLVGGLLGAQDLPPALIERMLETTEGNPLFLSELLRMLVDDGAIVRSGTSWVAAGGADAVQVPPTIHALLTARIERLRADERAVVERAAVIGKQFYRGAVAELVAPPVRLGIDTHLETLRRKEMVEPEGTYWIDEPVYRFHHVLIRDAAYRLLLKEARAELHERFAEWLAAKAGELVGEHEEVIAYHLEQAHEYRRQLGPLDDRGRAIGARAASLLASAGRRALAREDLAAAANLLQRAIDRDAGDEGGMLWQLGEALLSAGDLGRAGNVIRRLADWDFDRAAVLEIQLKALSGSGTLEELLARVTAATAALAARGDGAGEAKGHHVTAQVQALLGRVADVEASLDRALIVARGVDDPRRVTGVLAAAPRAALWGPSPVVRASGRCLDIVRILRMTPGNRHVEAVALRCQAVLEAMRGRSHAAREIIDSGRATLEELGLGLELHELALHAGIVELLAGRPQDAEAMFRDAQAGFEGLGVGAGAAQAGALLGRALVDQGRATEAIAATSFAEAHAGGDLKTTITWLSVRAEALAQQGDVDHARELAQRAVTLADPTDALADKADAYMALARIMHAAGDNAAATGAAGSALALYEAKDHVVGADAARRLMAVLPAGAGGEPAAGAQESNYPHPAADAVLGASPPEQWYREYMRLWNAHDQDGSLALLAEAYRMTDHRAPALWDPVRSREELRPVNSSAWAAAPDVRMDVEEILAHDDRVIALVLTFSGTLAQGGGAMSIPIGVVSVIENLHHISMDVYDPEDRASILARYAELGGGTSPTDRDVLAFYDRLAQLWAERDVDRLAEAFDDQYVLIDHRRVGWGEVRGRAAIQAEIRSALEGSPDIAFRVEEVIDSAPDLVAMRVVFAGHTSDGGGWFELQLGYVGELRDGRLAHVEWFPPNAIISIRVCFAERRGARLLGSLPPERAAARFVELFGRRDRDALPQVWSEDCVFVDHRAMAWEELHGRAGLVEIVESAWRISGDIRAVATEVLAVDERVIALLITYTGSWTDGGGLGELPTGIVNLVEGGQIVRSEQFDPEDRVGMLSRYAQLGGGLGPLGDSPVEEHCRRQAHRYAARDLDGLLDLVAEDWIQIDHRPLGWGRVDKDRYRREQEAIWAACSVVWMEVDEVLACDGRVLAVIGTYRGKAKQEMGGGRFDYSVGTIQVVENDSMMRTEWFEPDDRAAIMERYRELTVDRASGRGDRAPERFFDEFFSRLRAHRFDDLGELVAEDWCWRDHRALGWEEETGRDRCVAIMRSFMDASPDVRGEFDEVIACDDRVIAVRMAWRGRGVKAGELEVTAGAVYVVENGHWKSADFYDAEDRRAVVARYVELGGGLSLLGDTPVERHARTFACRSAAADIDGVMAMLAEDWVQVDRRQLAWPEQHKNHYRAQQEAIWNGTADIRIEYDEVIACDGAVLAGIMTYRGTAEPAMGGGQFEYSVGNVQVTREGVTVRNEWFDPEDRDAIMRRYRELADG